MSLLTKYAIRLLDRSVKSPKKGLPDDIFYYISRNTPLINVDLLIKDESNRVLLAWRDDQYSGKGWHIPGGIIRYKENIKDRINKVAENEIDSCVVCSKEPIAINEIVANGQKNRAHFISLLYSCKISKEYRINNGGLESNHPGFLKWHNKCPSNLLSWHEIYRKYM
jgi:ADP-ribose pyrophosphatase YjhB (NUDIX family)